VELILDYSSKTPGAALVILPEIEGPHGDPFFDSVTKSPLVAKLMGHLQKENTKTYIASVKKKFLSPLENVPAGEL